MTVTSAGEMETLRGMNARPKRYLSVNPRAKHMGGVITGFLTDTNTGSIHSILFTHDGTYDQALFRMTADIGTAPGLSDVGRVRVRSSSFNTGSAVTLPIALTAVGEFGMEAGHYVTVRREFRPWQIDYWLEPVYDGDGLIIGINEAFDYNRYFGSPHEGMEPCANIVAGLNADGTYKQVQFAGWTDPVTGKRTLHVENIASIAMSAGETISGQNWSAYGVKADGTNVDVLVDSGYTSTDQVVEFSFDPGFYYIELQAIQSDTYSHRMAIPIWAHDPDTFPPFTAANITSDLTDEWREMAAECFGQANEADEDVIPAGTDVCYWEEPAFALGDIPESYRLQAHGWITEDVPLLRRNGVFGIKWAGAGWWLDHFDGPTQALRDTGSTPTAWHEIRSIDRKRSLWFSINMYSTVGHLVNVFFGSGVTQTTDRLNLPQGTIWQQLKAVASRFSYSVLGCDSIGSIYVDQDYSHRTPDERLAITPLLDVYAQDWTDRGLPLTRLYSPNYSRVDVAGSIFYSGNYILYASAAPGKTKSQGTNRADMEGQYLPSTTPQGTLNWLSGLHWAWLNNPQSGADLPLIDNYDVVEPAWQCPIRIHWNEDTVHGTVLNSALYLVKRVSIEHSFEFDSETPAKVITWHVEKATTGFPGQTIPVIQEVGVTQKADDPPEEPAFFLRGDQETVFVFQAARNIAKTYDFQSTNPAWSSTSLASALPAGSIAAAEADAFSPYYQGSGDEVNGWFTFQPSSGAGRVYRIADVDATTPTVTQQHTFAHTGTFVAALKTERGTQNFVVGAYHTIAGDTYVFKTTDGSTWSEVQIASGVAISFPPIEIHVSPHTPGLVYIAGAFGADSTCRILVSTDYAATFTDLLTPATLDPIHGTILHVPYEAVGDDLIYYQHNTGSDVFLTRNSTVLTGMVDGSSDPIAPFGAFTLKTCDTDQNSGAIAAGECWVTLDAFATRTQVDGGATYNHCNVAGDDPLVTFWWRETNGDIGYRDTSGNIVSKKGAGGTTIANGANINIWGGPNP